MQKEEGGSQKRKGKKDGEKVEAEKKGEYLQTI